MPNEGKGIKMYGFVPHKLNVEGRPELGDFPFNVLFLSFFKEKGVDMVAHALYKPDLTTLEVNSEVKRMKYPNPYDDRSYLIIEKRLDRWVGMKSVIGKAVLISEGKTWEEFFGHFTAYGLNTGEKCLVEKMPQKPKTTI